MVDVIYVAACAKDTRLLRICVASIRYIYPEIPVHVLVSGNVPQRVLDELKGVFRVEVAVIESGDYGWGFVKFEPLFVKRCERFLVLDSDTTLLGPVLDVDNDDGGLFLVDKETQSEAETNRLYYDWENVRALDIAAKSPEFVFNSGQWIGTSGILQRDDFGRWLNWDMPRTLRYPGTFMQGEQGLLNYVINQQVRNNGLRVSREKIMRWPGHDVSDLKLADVARGESSPHPEIMHWAGFKAPRVEALPRADILLFFERFYYERQGGGERLRRKRALHAQIEYRVRELIVRIMQRSKFGLGGFANLKPAIGKMAAPCK